MADKKWYVVHTYSGFENKVRLSVQEQFRAGIEHKTIQQALHGLIIEVHNNPEEAISDGDQSLTPKNFAQLMKELKPVAEAVGRKL